MQKVGIALVILACGSFTVHSLEQKGGALSLLARVDHLVYAGPDLKVAIEKLEQLLGVRAAPGGQHPGRGTRNALIALGPTSYLEVIGPDPGQPKPDLPRPFGIDTLSEPRLAAWAAKESDLTQLAGGAAERGVRLGEVISGSRQRPDGVLLSWRYTNPRTVVADGIVPFFIDWGKTPHPSASAAVGASLVALGAEHPEADRVQKVLEQLGIDLRVTQGREPRLTAAINSPRGRIVLR